MFTKEQLREAIAIAFAIGHRWSDPESTSDSIEYALKNHEKPEHVEGSMRETAILEAIGPETTPPSPPGYSRAFVEAVAQRALCVGARVRVLTDLPANTFPRVTQWGIIAAEAVLFTGTNCAQDSQDTKTLIPHCIAFAEKKLGEKATEPDASKQLLGAPARIRFSNGIVFGARVAAVSDGRVDVEIEVPAIPSMEQNEQDEVEEQACAKPAHGGPEIKPGDTMVDANGQIVGTAMGVPPLGCKPRWLVDEARAEELGAAIGRFCEAGRMNDPLVREWTSELDEILQRKMTREYKRFAGFGGNAQ